MEILAIDYSGFISIDKDDIVIETIDPKTGDMIPVDVRDMDAKTLIDGVHKGTYYLNLEKSMPKALDGENNFDISIEDDNGDNDY
jgi:hypothetical protein